MLTTTLSFRKTNLVSLILFIVSLMVLNFSVVTTRAAIPDDIKDSACAGIHNGGKCDRNAAEGSVNSLLSTVLNILSWIVGVVSVIMIIVGGFKFIISNGDPAGAKSARSTIIYALVGVAVVALAQLMVNFVLKQTVGK